jgi:hypothetical protein
VALLALNPVVIIEVVGQGRVDAYIGLALLSAALAAERRPHLAAVLVAIAALIKLPALLGLAALVLWVWHRSTFRRAVTVGAAGGVPMLLAYGVAGGRAALEPVMDLRTISNEVSIWILAREHGLAHLLGDLDDPLGPIGAATTLATVAALILGILLLLPHLGNRVPAYAIACPLLAYLLTSTYPTARYLVWVLPLLLLRPTAAAIAALAVSSSILLYTHSGASLHAAGVDDDRVAFLEPLDGPVIRVVSALPVVLALAAIGALAVVAVRALLRRDEWIPMAGTRRGPP